MFLYHYFIPLLISFVLVALVVDEVTQIGGRAVELEQKRAALAIWLVAAFASFWFYKPLTYYERPLTPQELNRRAIVALWDLRCITCPHNDGLCGTSPQ
jgi:dolichyl-phosphate-mannose--protein O-mannosyl transferase